MRRTWREVTITVLTIFAVLAPVPSIANSASATNGADGTANQSVYSYDGTTYAYDTPTLASPPGLSVALCLGIWLVEA